MYEPAVLEGSQLKRCGSFKMNRDSAHAALTRLMATDPMAVFRAVVPTPSEQATNEKSDLYQAQVLAVAVETLNATKEGAFAGTGGGIGPGAGGGSGFAPASVPAPARASAGAFAPSVAPGLDVEKIKHGMVSTYLAAGAAAAPGIAPEPQRGGTSLVAAGVRGSQLELAVGSYVEARLGQACETGTGSPMTPPASCQTWPAAHDSSLLILGDTEGVARNGYAFKFLPCSQKDFCVGFNVLVDPARACGLDPPAPLGILAAAMSPDELAALRDHGVQPVRQRPCVLCLRIKVMARFAKDLVSSANGQYAGSSPADGRLSGPLTYVNSVGPGEYSDSACTNIPPGADVGMGGRVAMVQFWNLKWVFGESPNPSTVSRQLWFVDQSAMLHDKGVCSAGASVASAVGPAAPMAVRGARSIVSAEVLDRPGDVRRLPQVPYGITACAPYVPQFSTHVPETGVGAGAGAGAGTDSGTPAVNIPVEECGLPGFESVVVGRGEDRTRIDVVAAAAVAAAVGAMEHVPAPGALASGGGSGWHATGGGARMDEGPMGAPSPGRAFSLSDF